MQHDFTDLIETATIETRISGKSGKPYQMLVIDLGNQINFQYVCINGEQNVIAALMQTIKK